jgi:predicted CXXCH cytochrome family protein
MRRRLDVRAIMACLCLLLAAGTDALAATGVANTPHNLSSSGPGPIKVAGESRVCIFCHTPHSANPIAPLWNRNDPGTYYQTYESTTMQAQVGQPSGSSRLCLSCHDGTIALTQTFNSHNLGGTAVYISPQDRGYIGTDLSDDHPISFVYDSALATRNPQLVDPALLPQELPLDSDGQLQCTTCHDAHDDTFGNFLRMDNADSRMCTECHQMTGWNSSPHMSSTAPLSGARMDTWENLHASTVQGAACEACHRPHSAGGRQRLLRHEAEEDNCLDCHDGSVAAANVSTAFQAPYTHPVGQTTGVHDPTEDPLTMPEHVECSDCHDPHRCSSTGTDTPPFIKPVMQGASGLSSLGQPVAEATYEYEVCYKCHSVRQFALETLVDRVFDTNNQAEQFSPNNASFHPVEVQGKSLSVPSLLQPLTTASMIYCTDCHASDASSGSTGPHGSAYRGLLVRNYALIDGQAESPQAYALCYGCHNRASILANQSFSEHSRHIVQEATPCFVCHDAHGVSSQLAPPDQSTHLINFDSDVVTASPTTSTGPTYKDLGMGKGTCTLMCHGEDHVDRHYPD